jgi:hypothetical protein
MPNHAPLVGHVGTRVEIDGSNFPTNATVNLFTTPDYSTSKCKDSSLKNPSNYGLTPFDSNGNNNNGSGNSQQGDAAAISTKDNSFTVAQPVQIKVSAQSNPSAQPGGSVTINAGDTVTVSGTGWLPPQQLAVDIESSNGILTSTTVPSSGIDSMTGNFSVNLSISTTADPRDYDVKVYAPNEPTMKQTVPAAITVNSSDNATPQATATAQTTAQAASTPVANANSTSGNSAGSGSNLLAFALAGLGAILVIVGITVFVIYSRGKPV